MMLDRSLLHYFVRDALAPYSEDFAVRDKQNPITIQLNGNLYSIHVSYIHDSGNNRNNEDEVRIQISRGLIEQQRKRYEEGARVAFIGFFKGGRTFVAWDPHHIFSLAAKRMVSVYARQSQEDKVERQSVAVHQFKAGILKEISFAIALPSNALGFYLENISHFHHIQSEDGIISLIHKYEDVLLGDNINITSGDFNIEHEGKRERFTFTRKAYPRDPRFAKHVLAAYDYTCCICNRQLAIVQAAHIIPHSEAQSPNTVANGLALCIEHHRLYDDALLLPGPGRRLVFNNKRAEYLQQTKQERGLDAIAAQEGHEFSPPKFADCYPSDDYLRQGLEIRLGQ